MSFESPVSRRSLLRAASAVPLYLAARNLSPIPSRAGSGGDFDVVNSIELAPIPGVHEGTGEHEDRRWVVDPDSVAGTGKLRFGGHDGRITSFLFEIPASVVPNWFAVAVPSGVTSFSNANLFFHPLPAQAGYRDADYAKKSGKWPQLFYYAERLGYQLDAAGCDQVLVMPFLTQAATSTGILPHGWAPILYRILSQVRSAMGADNGFPLAPGKLVIGSFSVGIVYAQAFRKAAAGLDAVLAEQWDLDGMFSSASAQSRALVSNSSCRAIKYDQGAGAATDVFHLPIGRWKDAPARPATAGHVHGMIADYMYRHAATISAVGPA